MELLYLSRLISSSSLATFSGLVAIIFWSLSATLIFSLSHLPPFYVMAVTMGVGGLPALIFFFLNPKSLKNIPWWFFILGIFLLSINQFSYVAAFHFAPPETVDLINYLWPLMNILGAAFILKERTRPTLIVSALLCLYALTLLPLSRGQYSEHSFLGIFLALLSALSWSAYSLTTKHFSHLPPFTCSLFCAASSVIAAILHFANETSASPSLQDLAALLFVGLLITGSSYTLWELSIKKGNMQFLSLLAYLNPFLSIVWLVLFGATPLSSRLVAATCLLSIAIFLPSKKHILLKKHNIILFLTRF